MKKTSKRRIKYIFLHCSATPEGKDFTVKDIDNWHKQRGFNEIGYNYVVYRDGTVHEGRDVDKIPAHATGWNSNSIGICYIGGMDKDNKKPKDTRTQDQRFALFKLVSELLDMYDLTIDAVMGHCYVANKACPSFDMGKFKQELKMFMDKRKNTQSK